MRTILDKAKRKALSLRLAPQLYGALLAEAQRNGRSLTAEVECLLTQGLPSAETKRMWRLMDWLRSPYWQSAGPFDQDLGDLWVA